MPHRTRTVRDHPLAPPGGRLGVARINLYEKIGPGTHACNWCGDSVTWSADRYAADALLADHLDWDACDDRPENLVPSCNTCNAHRRKKNRGEGGKIRDDELTMLWGGKKTRAVERVCEACKKTFPTIPAEVKAGKGKYCSLSCARRGSRVPRS